MRLTTPNITSPFGLDVYGSMLGRGYDMADLDNLGSWLNPYGTMRDVMLDLDAVAADNLNDRPTRHQEVGEGLACRGFLPPHPPGPSR